MNKVSKYDGDGNDNSDDDDDILELVRMNIYKSSGGSARSNNNNNNSNNSIFSIDICYLRDLQLTISQLLLIRLYEQAEIFDRKVKQLELQCAKLMTLLKTSYNRAKVCVFISN
jgi:hypothetical protein